MKFTRIIISIVVILVVGFATNMAINNSKDQEIPDTRIDNQGYWKRLAAKGVVPYNPEVKVAPAIYTGSELKAALVSTVNSPDVPVTEINSLQSENSVFINPLDETNILNSNNSATNPLDTAFGANSFHSINSGINWEGNIEGAGENNFGDPAATIGLNGRWYINYINNNYNMGVSYSDDMGETWTIKNATPSPDIECDKNHMWIDNNPDSPFEGNLYIAWTNFSDIDLGEIGFSYSSDHGETWDMVTDISSAVAAGSHNQGVNLSTGPNGELYAVWAIYDSWPSGGSDESAIGFAKSLDGGITWEPAIRIISDIRGIRSSGTTKDMRVNSFPVATVDNSNSADRGAIYVTWSNKGIPGINNGYDIDVYIIKSIDNGDTWSDPIKVNQSNYGQGKQHYLPWITCDPTHGILSLIYYDDRNVAIDQCEVYCANSVDGGQTWEEFKVSDVSFTPSPIPGLADNYMGDYLGIHAKNGVVYPIWTDNRLGYAMSFCSPYETNPVNRPENLEGEVIFETGEVHLSWSFENTPDFESFIIYRDGDSVASVDDTVFTEILQDYGPYRYRVTAYYSNDIESGASGILIQWGGVGINITPDSIYNHLPTGEISEHPITIINDGQLDLHYNISLRSNSQKNRTYCDASGGGGTGNEYISGVEVGDIVNLNTGSDNYTDYDQLSTTMKVGHSYDIHVINGQPYDLDQCGVWIDWNIDGIFGEDELTVLNGQTLLPDYYGTIVPPPGTVTGTTKMRVRLTYSGSLNPCGNTTFGEVEDYTINTQGWMDINKLYDTVAPGDTSIVIVSLNSNELPDGHYSTNLVINTNDSENEEIEIPVSLDVSHIIVTASASETEVCAGSLIILQASIDGLFDSIHYQWSSKPPGYTSEKARPYAIPTVPTWYIISAQDGDYTVYDSVYVHAFPLPIINFGTDTTICGSQTITLDAGNDGISYLWSTGDTSSSIVIDSSGIGFGDTIISVEVQDSIGCTASREIIIEFINCTWISDMEPSPIRIYPVPNNGIFYIQTEVSGIETFGLKILDASGSAVYSDSNLSIFNNRTKLDVRFLKSGAYTLLISLRDDFYVEKLIITK